MDRNSLSNSSWENPFGLSGNIPSSSISSDEQFFGEELKAFFDKEEKLYQSTSSSVKSDQSNHTEKNSAMASGITIRSFMVESGESDLIHQKLTMSQYLAYKSEPMGQLGDSASFRERPYFSFHDRASLQSSNSEKNESIENEPEFNPDFSQEPSWLKKKSLSSLSSSENLEIPSKSPENSESWLVGRNSSLNSNSLKAQISNLDSSNKIKESSIRHLTTQSAYNTDAKQAGLCTTVRDVAETSELPSLYWKPHEKDKVLDNDSHVDLGLSHMEIAPEKRASCSYVAGHVESLSLGGDSSRRPSEIAPSSQNSSSPATTVRENSDFPRCDSLISEPQLSSTREITDIDFSTSEKHVHFLSDAHRLEVSHISMEKPSLRLDTLLEVPAKPNLCSTALTPSAKSSEYMARLLADLSENGTAIEHTQNRQNIHSNKIPDLETTKNLNLEWQQLGRDLTQHDPNGFSPDSWVAVFANTSSLSTPLLMNKIKEHVLRLNGQSMSSVVLPSESSGIGESGFEVTESRVNSAFDIPSNKISVNTGLSPLRKCEKNLNQESGESLSREKNPVIPHLSVVQSYSEPKQDKSSSSTKIGVNPVFKIPVEELAKNDHNLKDFVTQSTSSVTKETPTPDIPKLSFGVAQIKTNLMEDKLALQKPLVKCNKSQVYFGGMKLRQPQIQNLVVRNSSFKQELELELLIKDSDAFYLLESDRSSLVSRRKIILEPRQECCIDLVFQPNCLGHLTTKLNLYPRCESTKKVKYTVDLFGYGGSSNIHHLSRDVGSQNRALIPKLKGTYWSCQLTLENRGNIPGFVFIQHIQDNETMIEPYGCIVMPQFCCVNSGDFKELQIFIHPSKDRKLTSFKLRLLWGDEPLRSRWMKCIANGAPISPTKEFTGVDWSRLLLRSEGSEDNLSLKPTVSEDDMALFYNNVKLEEVTVTFPENGQDSHFVTLAAEPATVLEASTAVSDTMLSQRRLTANPVISKSSSDMCVSAGVTELIFPSTKVGTTSSQKIPLQNWSGVKQEVRLKEINGPFSMKHTLSAVPGGYYTRLPIQFQPCKSGSHSGSVVLDVGQNGQSLIIALKGEAF